MGRFDLLFQDNFDTTILIELKARTLKYEDATQVAKYRDELKRNGCKNIVMWLVAPQIPFSVREFLDDKGIEYTEIHIAEFRHVAERRKFVIKSESEESRPASPASIGSGGAKTNTTSVISRRRPKFSSGAVVPTGQTVTAPSVLQWEAYGHDLRLKNPDAFDAKRFAGLLDTFASAVRKEKNRTLVADLRAWAEDPIHAQLASSVIESLLRWTINCTNWRATAPYAYEVWVFLFGAPAPCWKEWDPSNSCYHFSQEAWMQWYKSLGTNPEVS